MRAVGALGIVSGALAALAGAALATSADRFSVWREVGFWVSVAGGVLMGVGVTLRWGAYRLLVGRRTTVELWILCLFAACFTAQIVVGIVLTVMTALVD